MSLHCYLYANANPVSLSDPGGKFIGEMMTVVMMMSIPYVEFQGAMQLAAMAIYGGGKRPDSDRKLLFLEAALWWKQGNGASLTVDLDKIDMGICASDFGSVGQRKSFNFASKRYCFSFNTALVYGRLELTLTSTNTIIATKGGDMYDFDIPDPLNPDLIVRNVETAGGAVLHGPGKPFWINIVGTKAISP